MKTKKMLVMGSSNASCDIIKYAQSQGIHVIVTDYLDVHISPAKQMANEYWMISTSDIDLLEQKCKEENVNAVLCGVSGFNINQSMALCSRLGLPFYCTPDALHFGRDKADFKKMCRAVGVPVAEDYFLSDQLTDKELEQVKYPVVVKPVDKGANVGISFCYNNEDIKSAFKLVRSVSSNPKIVVERMLHGQEWYSSYAIHNGKVKFLALNAMYHEPGYPSNCYTITTTATNHIEQYLKEINPQIEVLLEHIGCTYGYAWVQVMLDEDGKFYVIEMGYRLDSDKMFLPYKDILGYDVIKEMVDYACGIEKDSSILPSSQTKAFKKCGCGHMLWSKKAGKICKIEGLELVAQQPGFVVDYWMTNYHVGKYVDKYKSMGTITYTANDCDELCKMIEFVNDTVRVIDENGEDLIIKYTNFDYLKKVYREGLEGK